MFQPTNAYFFNVVNVESGSVVVVNNKSPSNTVSSVLPIVSYWSDVVWIQFVKAAMDAGKDVNQLKDSIHSCFQYFITNEVTLKTMNTALRNRGHNSIPTWEEKITWTMDEEEGQALLGTPNGSGCGFLLATHKSKLGLNTIKDVTIWADEPMELGESKGALSMYFTVKPVSADRRVGAREL